MKKLFFLLLSVFLSLQTSYGQGKFKFGTVSLNELQMANHPVDSLAPAAVLYEYCDNYYNYGEDGFTIITEYTVRIKVFTSEGVDLANHSFSLRKRWGRDNGDSYVGLTGYTYNLENGKIVKEKLAKNYIFTEDVSEYVRRIKFALPAVKPGSVVEYKYTITSTRYGASQIYYFQRDIPVDYSYYSIKIPEYFRFSREVTGYERVDVNIKKEHQIFALKQGRSMQCMAETVKAEVHSLPALKDDGYTFYHRDYLTGIKFELKSIIITGVLNKFFSTSWDDVAKQMMESDNFGGKLKYKNLFKEALPSIVQSDKAEKEKLRDILDMVRNRVKWNKNEASFIRDPQKALKEGIGNSAEINALLICALKEAGFFAYPVLMRLRSDGRLPISHPSDRFTYFIAGVTSGDNTYYLDATRTYTDVNVLPPDCLVEKAFCILPNENKWADLSALINNTVKTTLHISFDETTGTLEGQCAKFYNNVTAYRFLKEYADAKDQDDYIKTLEERMKIQITDYKTNNTRNSTAFLATETYQFTDEHISLNNNIISFSPLLFLKMDSNPFKPEKRNLPVEFPYPYESRVDIRILLPEGYVFDEVPNSAKYACQEKGEQMASFTYVVKQEGNVLNVSYIYDLNTNIIPGVRYTTFRDFYSKVYAKTNEPVIVKKITGK